MIPSCAKTRPRADLRQTSLSTSEKAFASGISAHCAEAGQPDWVIQAQMGHVSPAMMKTYSHVRRHALDQAAAALEPTFPFRPIEAEGDEEHVSEPVTPHAASQFASQSGEREPSELEIVKESGSSGWTRTSNPPVNSRMLCH